MSDKQMFDQVYCSQCGGSFGPGYHGYSHCSDHTESALASQQKADDIHTCSYYCTRPACIRAQRDELRDKMEAQQKEMDRLTASERSAWNAAVQRDEEIERLKAAQQKETPAKQNEWKEAVIEKLIVCHIYQKKHDDDPIGALNDLLSWEIKIALDPQVSSEAQALIDRGWIAAQQKAEPAIKTLADLDWNRLAGKQRRALDPDHQWAFDLLYEPMKSALDPDGIRLLREALDWVGLDSPMFEKIDAYLAKSPVEPAKRERAMELVDDLLYATRDVITGQRLDAGVYGHAPIEDIEEAVALLKEAYGL